MQRHIFWCVVNLRTIWYLRMEVFYVFIFVDCIYLFFLHAYVCVLFYMQHSRDDCKQKHNNLTLSPASSSKSFITSEVPPGSFRHKTLNIKGKLH